jgi:RNA polymerase sigma factor (sigma-70 family)
MEELKKICRGILKNKIELLDDLFQVAIEQFLKNKKVIDLPDKERLYFFARIVRNQYNSNSSKYHYTYRKHHFADIIPIEELEIPDEVYEEIPIDMNWVKKELSKLDWYYSRLFELYIEEGCSVTKLSKRTTIPINSVSRDINKVRKELNKRRNGMWM